LVLLYRFVLDGIIVATLPVVVARVGLQIAGVLVLVPSDLPRVRRDAGA
jgi:hypothetical protein